jgi:hypothetical protein
MCDTVTYTQPYYGDPNWNKTLAIPQLDPSEGTLDSVSLLVTGSGTASLSYQNNSPSSTSNSAYVDLIWKVARADGPVLLTSDLEWQVAWTCAKGASYNAGPWNAAPTPTALVYTVPTDLAYFTGAGSADFNASGNNSVMERLGGGNYSISVPTSLGVVVSVTYDYTPAAAVPEPSSLAILGFGAVSLLAYAWRKRRPTA